MFYVEHYKLNCFCKNYPINNKKSAEADCGVDHKGLEPLTSSMPWKRSSQLS